MDGATVAGCLSRGGYKAPGISASLTFWAITPPVSCHALMFIIFMREAAPELPRLLSNDH